MIKRETKESKSSSGDILEMKFNSGGEDMVMRWERGERRNRGISGTTFIRCRNTVASFCFQHPLG